MAEEKVSDEAEGLEDIFGWVRTQFDCENCQLTFDEEGDQTGNVVECPDCHTKFYCREVR